MVSIFFDYVLLDFFLFLLYFVFVMFSYSGGYYISIFFVLDKVSFLLFFLSLWMLLLLIKVALKYKKEVYSYLSFKLISVILVLFLLVAFCFYNVLGFYIFFEVSLLPLIFMILGWGYQVERLQASFYLFIYTIFGSIPFLLVIFFLDSAFLNTTWGVFLFVLLTNKYYFIVMLIVFLSFFVKLPLYGFHLWLPKAHVEAPVGGSMILAAVLLKLGAYGVYRFLFILLFFSFFFDFLVLISFWGAFLCSIVCLRQPDMKSLVAYSSISHIGVLISGYFLFGWFSTSGALLILLAHGFCSSCLFFLVNFVYERNLTRQLIVSRGQIAVFYYVAAFWFLFLAINFGAPPFLNLLGEILILFNTGVVSPYLLLIFGLIRFFVAAYCIFLFRTLLHGQMFKFFAFYAEMDSVFLVFFFHFFPLLMLVLKIEVFWV